MNVDEVKKRVSVILESNSEKIIHDGELIAKNPELGFKEYKTSNLIKERFKLLNLPYKDNIAITGVRADLKGRSSRCKVAYFAELDALMCPTHPQANSEGLSHVCGHNIQVAVLLGVAEALIEVGINKFLDGDIIFIGVPAEELIEIEYRRALKEQGKIEFLTGKQQLIYEGVLDDVDMALMSHIQIQEDDGILITPSGTMNGAIAKYIQYKGLASHAGAAPHLGINALNAALLGLQAVNMLRETFKEEDYIRVHPIITKGGTIVNVIPDDVRIESFVRAKKTEILFSTNKKVDQCFKAGGDAIGAEVKIENVPGYMPFNPNKVLDRIYLKNAEAVVGKAKVGDSIHNNASTDMGDVSQIMPAIHSWIHAVKGKLHGADFQISDPYNAYIQNAKIISWTLIDLLVNGAKEGLEIKKSSIDYITRKAWIDNWYGKI